MSTVVFSGAVKIFFGQIWLTPSNR